MSRFVDQMAEAEDVAKAIFPKDSVFTWKLRRDPEGGGPELWLDIGLRNCQALEGIGLMEQFDESYWLAVGNTRGFRVTHHYII